MSRPAVLVADREAWQRMHLETGLAEAGIPAEVGSAFLIGEDELAERVSGVQVLVVALAPVTRRVLDRGEALRLVCKAGIGTDNIDLEAARARGIRVTRTPDVNLDGVAEYTIGAMLALARDLLPLDGGVRAGEWAALRRSHSGLLPDLAGESLGIVGFGGIGSRLARIAETFGMRVQTADPKFDAGARAPERVTVMSLDELLRSSRFVSVNAVLTAETVHLIGRHQLELMRPDAFLINASRGPIVDTVALAQALADGRLAGAAVDVMEVEPPPTDHPLLRAPRCILTPHLAGTSAGGYRNIGRMIVQQVQTYLAGGEQHPSHLVA